MINMKTDKTDNERLNQIKELFGAIPEDAILSEEEEQFLKERSRLENREDSTPGLLIRSQIK